MSQIKVRIQTDIYWGDNPPMLECIDSIDVRNYQWLYPDWLHID